jgi:GNAT superfamily N-acetyltransferase
MTREAHFKIEQAGKDSVSILMRHRECMWREIGNYTEEQIRISQENYSAWLSRKLSAGELFAFIAYDDAREAAGSGCVWVQSTGPKPHNPDGIVSYLMSMYTVEKFRRQGVAAAILNKAIEFSRQKGIRRMYLHASRFGHPLYQKAGFVESNEMRLDL